MGGDQFAMGYEEVAIVVERRKRTEMIAYNCMGGWMSSLLLEVCLSELIHWWCLHAQYILFNKDVMKGAEFSHCLFEARDRSVL